MRRLVIAICCALLTVHNVKAEEVLEHELKYPEGQGPFPVMILLHGSGGHLKLGDRIPKYLELGYAVAVPDYFTRFGISRDNRFSAFKERRPDIEAALLRFAKYVKQQENVDSSRTYSTGFSAGGFYAAFLACQKAVAAGVAHYGVWAYPGYKDLKKKYPAQYFDNECNPFLALHGEKDKIQKIKNAKRAFDYIKKTKNPFEFYVYPKGGHRWEKPDQGTEYIAEDALKRTHEFVQSVGQ
jgi:dienelactone hydrolase